MITIIFFGIFVGVILAFFLAPILMIANSQRLKEMDGKITEFENTSYSSSEERERAKQVLKKELIKIKAKISAVDKKAIEKAGDKIAIL